MESRYENPRANLAHPNFFTFYTAIGVKGRLFSPSVFDEFPDWLLASTSVLAAISGC